MLKIILVIKNNIAEYMDCIIFVFSKAHFVFSKAQIVYFLKIKSIVDSIPT